MSLSHACSLETDLHAAIREKYARMATRRRFHFKYPTGRDGLAGLGYPPNLTDALPRAPVLGFCGVGNVLDMGAIAPGEAVLDAGCGTGCDALMAARLTGPRGLVVGVDRVPEMLALARCESRQGVAAPVRFVQADVAALPFADARFDVVLTNGVLNMVFDKGRALAELYRLLRPGGRLHVADVMLADASPWRPDPATFFQ